MPFLIRIIAQRFAVLFFSFLAFLGINPEISVPTADEVQIVEENQTKLVQEILTPNSETKSTEKTLQIEDQLKQVAEEVVENQTKTQNIIEEIVNVPQITSTDSGIIASTDLIDDVIVNIVCVNRSSGLINMTTGSGVVVSPSGIVLTNSHVANTFLFDDKDSLNYKNCTIRRENIPTYGFNAEIVYLPEDWLVENQSFFTDVNPRGSGENDYALLAITTNTNPALKTPSSFKYASLMTNESKIEESAQIEIGAYPGSHTGIFEIDSNVSLRKVTSYIKELITFDRTTVDIISTGPNSAAKKGSSGGGVFLGDELLGIITTTDGYGSEAYLNAITLPYIIRDFRDDTGSSFSSFIYRNKESLISEFNFKKDSIKSLIADFL